jgi:hypothetical protein
MPLFLFLSIYQEQTLARCLSAVSMDRSSSQRSVCLYLSVGVLATTESDQSPSREEPRNYCRATPQEQATCLFVLGLLTFLDCRPWCDDALRTAARAGKSIWMMGCGSGWELNALLHLVPTAKVIGIDSAPAIVQAARRNLAAGALQSDPQVNVPRPLPFSNSRSWCD